MAREPQYLLDPRHKVLRELPRACQTLLLEAVSQFSLPIPPGQGVRQLVDKAGIKSHGLADVAYGAARTVGNHGGCKRGAATGVFLVDVLDDFFTPLMLKVHVNVRGLIPLPGDESFE